MKKSYLIFILISFSSDLAFSQINFSRDTSLQVIENTNRFNHAWVGGVNAIQLFYLIEQEIKFLLFWM